MLPTTRLADAGATPAEIEQLQAEHDASAPEAQASTLARLAGIAQNDIRAWLHSLREQGHLATTTAGNPAKDPAAVKALHTQLSAAKPKARARQRPKS